MSKWLFSCFQVLRILRQGTIQFSLALTFPWLAFCFQSCGFPILFFHISNHNLVWGYPCIPSLWKPRHRQHKDGFIRKSIRAELVHTIYFPSRLSKCNLGNDVWLLNFLPRLMEYLKTTEWSKARWQNHVGVLMGYAQKKQVGVSLWLLLQRTNSCPDLMIQSF